MSPEAGSQASQAGLELTMPPRMTREGSMGREVGNWSSSKCLEFDCGFHAKVQGCLLCFMFEGELWQGPRVLHVPNGSRTRYVAQDESGHLSPPPQCWEYRRGPPGLFYAVLGDRTHSLLQARYTLHLLSHGAPTPGEHCLCWRIPPPICHLFS